MSEPSIKAELESAYKVWEKEVELVSSCCGAETWEMYQSKLGRCSKCKENCTVEPEMPFNEWLEENKQHEN